MPYCGNMLIEMLIYLRFFNNEKLLSCNELAIDLIIEEFVEGWERSVRWFWKQSTATKALFSSVLVVLYSRIKSSSDASKYIVSLLLASRCFLTLSSLFKIERQTSIAFPKEISQVRADFGSFWLIKKRQDWSCFDCNVFWHLGVPVKTLNRLLHLRLSYLPFSSWSPLQLLNRKKK